MKLGFLIWKFPAQANTFIVNEIKEFIKSGRHDYHIYSLDKPSKYTFEIFQKDLDFIDRQKITYVKKQGLITERVFNESNIPFHSKLRSNQDLSEEECLEIEEHKHKSIANKFALVNLAKQMKKDGIDAIYSPFGNYTSDLALMLKVHYGIPYMFSVHAYDLFTEFNFPKQKAKTCHKALPISEYNKKYLQELGFSSLKTKVKRINFKSDSKGIKKFDTKHKYIFSASRIDPMKGYEYSIKAFSEFLKHHPDYHYYIAGRGDEEFELFLQKIVKDLKIQDRVHFLGFISNEEVISYIKGARFTILSSVELSNSDKEGIPTFFIESLCNGVPALGSRLSGIPELLDDNVGGLSEQADIGSIVGQMKKLAITSNRKFLKRRMSRACRDKISKMYDNLANINILNDILDSLVIEDFCIYKNLELESFIPIENPGLDSILLSLKPISKNKNFIYNPVNLPLKKLNDCPQNIFAGQSKKFVKTIKENFAWFNYEGGSIHEINKYINSFKDHDNILINHPLSFVILNHLFPDSKHILYIPSNKEHMEKILKERMKDKKNISDFAKSQMAMMELQASCMKKILEEGCLKVIKVDDEKFER